jgi:CheY-like chemotaxis protein
MPLKGSILVVEPHAPTAELIAEALEDAGYVVVLARARASMYVALATHEPDLLLYAIDRNDVVASAVIDAMRKLTDTAVPIVLMSTDRASANLRGIAACLLKPFTLDGLEDCVARHIRPLERTL